jgi:hypothetical protein
MTGWAVLVLTFFCVLVIGVCAATMVEAFRLYRRAWSLAPDTLFSLFDSLDL